MRNKLCDRQLLPVAMHFSISVARFGPIICLPSLFIDPLMRLHQQLRLTQQQQQQNSFKNQQVNKKCGEEIYAIFFQFQNFSPGGSWGNINKCGER